ncbi:hypothetical protein AKJ09_08369 [Labilithrix luteola]|uniref:Uncharacterized protein n=1 Tax=Labilithrix luteola TaxID=1391654 RepID=A0A0K1Q7C8_9BACT|nr:hypothetical protein AKJ09_08369 [Labilithrix luteola]
MLVSSSESRISNFEARRERGLPEAMFRSSRPVRQRNG